MNFSSLTGTARSISSSFSNDLVEVRKKQQMARRIMQSMKASNGDSNEENFRKWLDSVEGVKYGDFQMEKQTDFKVPKVLAVFGSDGTLLKVSPTFADDDQDEQKPQVSKIEEEDHFGFSAASGDNN